MLLLFVSYFTGVTGAGSFGNSSVTGSKIFFESGRTIVLSSEVELGDTFTG